MGAQSRPRIEKTGVHTKTCRECNSSVKVRVSIDRWSGVAGFRCPFCQTMQEA